MRSVLEEKEYILSHHQFIHFGRYFCKATKPNCNVNLSTDSLSCISSTFTSFNVVGLICTFE